MPWSSEQKREARDLERVRKSFVPQAFDAVDGRDVLAGKDRFKSEVLSQRSLFEIFTGTAELPEEEEKRTSYANKKKKKPINPSANSFGGQPSRVFNTVEDLLGSFDEWLSLRDRSRKDLFWLCKLLGKDVEPEVHQIVCDQFVQKNFDGAFPDGYTIKDVHDAINRQERFDQYGTPTKEMILLDPRGFYKSTIDGIDAIQWMINVPDIRIFLITGVYKLGIGFLKEIKGYLYLAEGGEPTEFQFLFPEYIIKGVDGTSKEPLLLKVRKHTQVAPTIWVNSIDSSLSGNHCDVKKGDDVIDDSNSNSDDVRIALKEKFDGTDNVLDPWGFSDNIGTRYFPTDWYGTRLDSYQQDPKENAIKYFRRACWTIKPEFIEVPLKELTEEMVVVTFPNKENFKKLRKKLLNNERSFRCQQLNEPAGLDRDDGDLVSFSEDAIRARIVNMKDVPNTGELYICWDWAWTANKQSDYSAGVCGRIYPEKDRYVITVLDIVFGKWIPSELALQIVLFNKKWNPAKTLIEASVGSNLLWDAIRNRAISYGVTIDAPIWKPPSVQANAKRTRIMGLETLLDDGRLTFVGGPWLSETISQLVGYTGRNKNKGRKDDIPDAMSYLSFFLPNGPLAKESEEAKAVERIQKDKRMRNMMYDRVFGSPVNPLPSINQLPGQGWKPRWPTR
jgi:phage terminase large subunit-like protein